MEEQNGELAIPPVQEEERDKSTAAFVEGIKEKEKLKTELANTTRELNKVKGQNYDLLKRIDHLENEVKELKEELNTQGKKINRPNSGRQRKASNLKKRPVKRKEPKKDKNEKKLLTTDSSKVDDPFESPEKLYEEEKVEQILKDKMKMTMTNIIYLFDIFLNWNNEDQKDHINISLVLIIKIHDLIKQLYRTSKMKSEQELYGVLSGAMLGTIHERIALLYPDLPLKTVLMAEKKFADADINGDGFESLLFGKSRMLWDVYDISDSMSRCPLNDLYLLITTTSKNEIPTKPESMSSTLRSFALSRTIDEVELEKILDSSEFLFTKQQVKDILKTIDIDQTGSIDFLECIQVLDSLRANRKTALPKTLQQSNSSVCSIQ